MKSTAGLTTKETGGGDWTHGEGDESPTSTASTAMEEETRPVFIRNPDGSLAQGVPQGYKELAAVRGPTPLFRGFMSPGVDSVEHDVNFIYGRHEKLFCTLLGIQLIFEILFDGIYLYFSKSSMDEVRVVYPAMTPQDLWVSFVASAVLDCLYMICYYSVGFLAAAKHKPIYFDIFSTLALIGIIAQLVMAYVNSFNPFIFFLRLLGYLYAKFLSSLLQSIHLFPEAVWADGMII
eukprot:Filipodium_phascolosomae@DN5901_c0_g1_i1.p1